MLNQAVGSILPAAAAVALSPIPIVAIVVVLGTSRARVNGVAFALGWVVGLTVVSAAVVGLLGGSDDADSATATGAGAMQLVLGALLLVLAARKWRSRPRAGDEPELPKWMDSVDHMSTLRALVLGVALSAVNPKNLALTASASASIAQAGLGTTDTVVAIAVFVVIGSVTVAGAVLAALLAPRRTAAPLAAIKSFMSANNAVIMMVILLVFGAKLLGEGIAGLVG